MSPQSSNPVLRRVILILLIINLLLIALIALTGNQRRVSLVATATAQSNEFFLAANADVILRSGPGENFPEQTIDGEVVTLEANRRVQPVAVDPSGEWFAVIPEANATPGWVSTQNARISGDVQVLQTDIGPTLTPTPFPRCEGMPVRAGILLHNFPSANAPILGERNTGSLTLAARHLGSPQWLLVEGEEGLDSPMVWVRESDLNLTGCDNLARRALSDILQDNLAGDEFVPLFSMRFPNMDFQIIEGSGEIITLENRIRVAPDDARPVVFAISEVGTSFGIPEVIVEFTYLPDAFERNDYVGIRLPFSEANDEYYEVRMQGNCRLQVQRIASFGGRSIEPDAQPESIHCQEGEQYLRVRLVRSQLEVTLNEDPIPSIVTVEDLGNLSNRGTMSFVMTGTPVEINTLVGYGLQR